MTTVVLWHGLAGSAQRTWRDPGWIDLLTDAGMDVIAPDLLGHGSAPQPVDPSAYEAFEEYALATLPPEPVAAVGFSLGARTLLVLAAQHPERFTRIVVGGVGENLFRHDGSSAALADALHAAVHPGDHGSTAEREPQRIVDHFLHLAERSGQSLDALIALLRRPQSVVLTAETLSRISQPTLVALGDTDFAGPIEPLLEAIPHAKSVILRNTDHFSTPKSFAFIDAALNFLEAD